MNMKKLLVCIAASFFSMTTYAQKSEIFQKDGKAIRGYDPVAFFTAGAPVMGDSMFTYNWKDATWLFASKENRELFRAQPEKYAPKYGGYCAYGTADGHKAPTEVGTWTILDGKLYFNYNNKVKEMWSRKTDEYIRKADVNWENIKDKE
jgi:YHS domain-containing protein